MNFSVTMSWAESNQDPSPNGLKDFKKFAQETKSRGRWTAGLIDSALKEFSFVNQCK